MKFRLSIVAFLIGLLSPHAQADRFFFSGDDTNDSHRARYIEGVLLEETGTHYRIRVAGGEITVPRAAVFRIEATSLSVADIDQLENNRRAELALAEEQRRQSQAEARSRRRANAVEASARRADSFVEASGGVEAALPVYDPIIGRLTPLETAAESVLQQEISGEIRRFAQREARQLRRALRRAWRLRNRR